jgi:wyosine [tRNA(Phe)-imidazoG37] synthetase (radical SAM superfamily)
MAASAFEDHSRRYAENRYVYPVVSRRSGGLSVGVNLSPDQRCNFSCVYCQVDRSEGRPYRPLDLARIDTELRVVLARVFDGSIWNDSRFENTPPHLRQLRDIAISGDGEPTVETGFAQVAESILRIREELGLRDVKVVVITNATGVGEPSVYAALASVLRSGGDVWAKLDAGTEEYYRRINGGPMSLDQIESNISDLARVGGVVIQSLFLRIDGTGPTDGELAAYRKRLARIAKAGRIAKVQIYTVARKPRDARVTPLADAELDAISRAVRDELGLSVETVRGSMS